MNGSLSTDGFCLVVFEVLRQRRSRCTHGWWVGVSLKAHQASTKLLEHPKKDWHQIESHLCVSLDFSMFMVPITIVDGRNPTN